MGHIARLFSQIERRIVMSKTKAPKRTDKLGRILEKGESQKENGLYVFKYNDASGKSHFLYSWKLEEGDKLPSGKRPCEALRTKKIEVVRDRLDGIDTVNKKKTVCQLYKEQCNLKPVIKKQSEKGRQNLMDMLKADDLGEMSVDSVKPSHAKAWAIRMHKKYAFQTINNAKRSLKACFYTAMEDDLIRKNPFNWKLSDVIPNDTEPKTALTLEQEKVLLDFVKNDSVYQKHYNAIVILLNTGLRISELCGLTVKDIDIEKGFINVDHQLLHDKEYYIDTPKTESSIRKIPMSPIVQLALRKQMKSLNKTKSVKIDGYSDFLFLQKNGNPLYGVYYTSVFNSIIKKYNKQNPDNELPKITPHTCRHTFCTRLANGDYPVKCLQYIMGHKNINITLNYYAHGSFELAKDALLKLVA